MNPELLVADSEMDIDFDPALLQVSGSLPMVLVPQADTLSFAEWLVESDVNVGEEEVLPTVFNVAQAKGQAVSDQLQKLNAESFKTVGAVLSSLGGIIGACGPVCAHTILESVARTGFSAPLGSNVFDTESRSLLPSDSPHRNNLSGFMEQLNTPEVKAFVEKHGWEALIQQVANFMGEGLSFIFGFGLVENVLDMAFDSFLPHKSSSRIAA